MAAIDNNQVNFRKFTPWAKSIYEMYTSRVCNTFIVSGNIGDYAFRLYNLTDYFMKLFEAMDGFAFDSAVV